MNAPPTLPGKIDNSALSLKKAAESSVTAFHFQLIHF